jgi:1,4-alpha-glucan branching enzyme
VAVVGPFNGWNPTVHPLARTTSGDWTITIYLPPGRIIYHFDVDGAAWLDPNDDGRIRNAWGSEYSVRHILSAR